MTNAQRALAEKCRELDIAEKKISELRKIIGKIKVYAIQELGSAFGEENESDESMENIIELCYKGYDISFGKPVRDSRYYMEKREKNFNPNFSKEQE